MLKRIFDLFLALAAFLLFLPFSILIFFVLKLTGEGEIFYIQRRVGRYGKDLDLYKFATMLKNSSNIGSGNITLRNDPRVLPFGKILRKTKINEAPQILNVIKGDLSIVGPRPLTKDHFDMIPEYIRDVTQKLKPGITGIGSIVFRDEERYISDSTKDPSDYYREFIAPYKGELEMWYYENKSFILDIGLVLLTAYMIFFPSSKVYNIFFRNLPRKSKFNP